MKKIQVYGPRKCGHADVNDNLYYGPPQARNAEGLVHYKFIPEGHTLNKEVNVKILCRLWDAVRRTCLEKWTQSWFLQSNSAPAHW
jgi:hypothetical protein